MLLCEALTRSCGLLPKVQLSTLSVTSSFLVHLGFQLYYNREHSMFRCQFSLSADLTQSNCEAQSVDRHFP